MFLQNIEFLNKWYFLLIIILFLLVFLFYKKLKKWVNFIFLSDIKKVFWKNSYLFYTKIVLLILIFINYLILFANPNKINVDDNIKKDWIDIVIALDVSLSMEAQDLNPTRIEAAKKVISDFISKTKTDRIWLVVFAWKPFTSIPLTFDYSILEETVARLSTDNINQQRSWLQWTAIWDAILMSKTLFSKKEEDKEREKVIILLTDWEANVWVDPELAWLSAKDEKIKIYTIWIWSEKWWFINYNVWPFVQRQEIPPLNDTTLKKIASETSWEYFRATDTNTFSKIFENLQKLDKKDIEIEVKKTYKQYYSPFVFSLIILLGIFIFSMLSKTEINTKLNNKL